MEKIFLVKPNENYAQQIVEYKREFLHYASSMDGCSELRRTDDPYRYIQFCRNCENERNVPQGYVPATSFLLVREYDDKLLGIIQIRHVLNDFLKIYGGHIGYSIRPTERRKGYAKQMLALALLECKKLNLEKVLITCNVDNVASEKTIVANGGVFENVIYFESQKETIKRFWIEIV